MLKVSLRAPGPVFLRAPGPVCLVKALRASDSCYISKEFVILTLSLRIPWLGL